MLSVNTNLASLNAQNNLGKSQGMLAQSLQRLSSGLRINSAKDDAAGLAISNRMTSQVNGLNQAVRNANDGISLAQTAEGALAESTNILQRIRELSVQSANDSNSSTDRASLQDEVSQLQQEINRIADSTTFNGKALFDGSFTAQKFQVGAEANETISFSIKATTATDIGNNTVTTDGTITAATTAAASLGGAASGNNNAGATLAISGPLNTSAESVTVTALDSAATIASSINAVSSTTGVEADARTVATLDGAVGTGAVSFNLYGTNSFGTSKDPVTINATISDITDLSGLADAINSRSASTGITATSNGSSVELVSEAGDDIGIEDWSGNTIDMTGIMADGSESGAGVTLGGATTTDSSVVGGYVTLKSSQAFSVSGGTGATISLSNSGASDLTSVADIDISTQAGANSALDTVDGALAYIDDVRGRLGAVQNRFDSTIANLQSVAENVTTARSRITDADFAMETANLTKAQILQQAGVAMLSQANQLPQVALSLLK